MLAKNDLSRAMAGFKGTRARATVCPALLRALPHNGKENPALLHMGEKKQRGECLRVPQCGAVVPIVKYALYLKCSRSRHAEPAGRGSGRPQTREGSRSSGKRSRRFFDRYIFSLIPALRSHQLTG